MNDIIELDYEDWCARFAPIQNPLNAHAPFEGCMFETFGPELAFVADQPAANVVVATTLPAKAEPQLGARPFWLAATILSGGCAPLR